MRIIHLPLLAVGISAGLAPAPKPAPADEALRAVLQRSEQLAERYLSSSAEAFGDECTFTTNLAQLASVRSLQADLALAIASCVNEESATPLKFHECLEEAFDDFALGLAELEEVDEARLELCLLTGGGVYDPDLDEDDFEDGVDHPYLPLLPGATWVYHADTEDGLEVITVTVTDETREVDGIECIVVRDTVTLDGELVEDTLDWYAQDEDGTVWYMGEIAQNYEDGELADLDGSWEAGEDGALPGIVMMSSPKVDATYRQELRLTEAEDAATVLSIDARADVPFGSFANCVQTADFTPLEPGVVEHKYYAPGVGMVLEVNPDTGERLELISFTPGS